MDINLLDEKFQILYQKETIFNVIKIQFIYLMVQVQLLK